MPIIDNLVYSTADMVAINAQNVTYTVNNLNYQSV